MKKTINKAMKKPVLLAAAMGLLLGLSSVSAEGITSLRGPAAIDEVSNSAGINRVLADREPIERGFVQQPPLVPHDVSGYKVNLKFNKCLTCHSWANYKKSGATKISQTHFADREGNDLANVSARRYFCSQCHVPQADAQPLVANDFKPISAISGN